MLHESGTCTWRRFYSVSLEKMIGVKSRGVVGDNGASNSCKVQSRGQACQDHRCRCQTPQARPTIGERKGKRGSAPCCMVMEE
jgi:hypothetical protein